MIISDLRALVGKPLPFLRMQVGLYRAVMNCSRIRLGDNPLKTKIHGPKCKTVSHPERKEEFYDPSFGSIVGSIFSLGISAACGANNSTRTIAAWTEYVPTEMLVSHTFNVSDCKSMTSQKFGNCTISDEIIDVPRGHY